MGKGLHLAQQALFARSDQGNGDAGLSGAARASDAVDIQFRIIRQVKLKTCEMSSMSKPRAATSVATSTLTWVLRKRPRVRSRGILVQVAVQGFGGITTRGQRIGKFTGGSACAHKDQGAGDFFHLEDAGQGGQFVPAVDDVAALLDGRQGYLLTLNGDRRGSCM